VVGMMVGLRGKELKEVGVHTSVKQEATSKLERLHDARFDFSTLASLHLLGKHCSWGTTG
jgi:hypothetical protein